jgi:hypothetical protein
MKAYPESIKHYSKNPTLPEPCANCRARSEERVAVYDRATDGFPPTAPSAYFDTPDTDIEQSVAQQADANPLRSVHPPLPPPALPSTHIHISRPAPARPRSVGQLAHGAVFNYFLATATCMPWRMGTRVPQVMRFGVTMPHGASITKGTRGSAPTHYTVQGRLIPLRACECFREGFREAGGRGGKRVVWDRRERQALTTTAAVSTTPRAKHT